MAVNEIFTLDLHDFVWISEFVCVTRVPGGWIYTIKNHNGTSTTATFVPFNRDFINMEDVITNKGDHGSWETY